MENNVTLRDFYAAHALQGLLATADGPRSFDSAVEYAFKYADAMVAKSKKRV